MTSTTIARTASYGTDSLLERLAMRGGLVLVSWSLHHGEHRPSAEIEAARLAREDAAQKRLALLVPVR